MTEAHAQFKNGNFAKFLRDYWAIGSTLLILVVGSSIAWANLSGQVQANIIVDTNQSAQIIKTSDEVNDLEKKYIEDITFIKTTLKEFKK